MGGGRRAEGVWPAPNPRAGKPVARGMGFPAHVGATADRRAERDALSRPRRTRKTLHAEAATPSSRT